MRKLLLTSALFLVLVAGLPFGAWAETKKDAVPEAEDLSKKAWAIIQEPQFSMKSVFEKDFSSPKYYGCDAPEAARELFLKAVELDPSLAEAWRGLGQVLEELGRCSTADAEQWLQLHWLGLDREKEYQVRVNKARIDPALATAYAKAETMYKKAVEIDPKDYRNWQAWGEILLKQAAMEEDAKKRGELLALASKNFSSAAKLNPDDPEIFLGWGRALLDWLAVENDPKTWASILNEAKDALTQYADLSPLENPEKGEIPENPKASAWSFMAELFQGVSRAPDLAPDQIKSLLELSLAARLQALKLSPDSDYNLAYLGLAHLSLAAVEEEAVVWREHLAKAKQYHIQSFQQYQKDGCSLGLWITDGWLRLTSQVDNKEKRQAFALEALDILNKQGLEAVEVLGVLNQISMSFKFGSRDDSYESPTTRDFMVMHISALMPSGPKRDQILAECEASLNGIVSKLDREKRGAALEDWGEILLGLAATETNPGKFKLLIDRSREKYQLAADEAEDIKAVFRNQAMAYNFALTETKDSERKGDFLKSAIKYQEQALAGKPDRSNLMFLAGMYYHLPELDKALSEKKEWYREKSIKLALKAAELDDEPEIGSRYFWNKERYFMPAQLLVVYSMDYRKRRMSWDFDRPYLAQAMGLYRREFQLLPERSDRVQSAGKPEARISHWMIADGQNPESYQYHITQKVAGLVSQIVQVSDPETMDAWDLAQLAGLHRYLVASGMLTPEYRLLYWQRAEKMLRRALELEADTAKAFENTPVGPPPEPRIIDGMIYDLEPGQTRPKNRAQQEGHIYDLTLAMSELGLLLAERNLWDEDQKEARLKEAEELWAGAEKMRPGVSRYARARWAAWRGDLETLKKNLTHNRNDTLALLYPTLEEAREDPALADYAHEPWFSRCWYGFEFTGRGHRAAGR